MAVPKISLLEKKPRVAYKCQMCKTMTRQNKFLWKSWFTGDELIICRDCAYKEKFGTKNMKQAKKDDKLEKQ